MKSTKISLVIAFLVAPTTAFAQGTARWSYSGTNELSIDHYGVSGDQRLSPFQFAGNFVTDRLSITARRDNHRGRKLLVGAEFSWSNSPYLAQDGFVAQLLRLELEDGSTALPYRVGAGDIVADLSRRVLQTTIKGASFEVQPLNAGVDQSFLVVSGSGARSWDDAFEDDGTSLYYNGVSYLIGAPSGDAMLVANYLNTSESVLVGGATESVARDSDVGSVYAEARIAGFLLEGEVAFLGSTFAGEPVDDRSFYAQLSRSDGSLSWRVRYEDNGRDYRPVGAVGVIADRRIGEFHGRYSLGRRGNLRGRVQIVESRYESVDPERANLGGIAYDGRLIRSRPTFQLRLSGDFNSARSETGLFDRFFKSWSLDLRDRIVGDLRVGYRLTYRDTEDRATGVLSRTYTDHSVSAGRAFQLGSGAGRWRLDVEGGLIVRKQEQVSDFDALSPLIDVAAANRRHRLAVHLSFLDQDYVLPSVDDLSYQTRRISYSFTYERHVVGFELGHELRRPSMSEKTDSLRATFRYRLSFGGAR